MIKIKIDTKETGLIQVLGNVSDESDCQVLLKNHQVETLSVGDICFYHSDHPETSMMVIERKTIKDLNSSIRDGRYKEQIIRLKSIHTPPTRVAFIIEGCQLKTAKGTIKVQRVKELRKSSMKGVLKYNKIQGEALYSAIMNILIRDEISLIESDDLEDTCQILAKIYQQLTKKYSEIVGHMVPQLDQVETHNYHYAKSIKSIKKHNVNPQVCFIDQLQSIPGVSVNFAIFIAEKYFNMNDLINAYHQIDMKNQELLKEFEAQQKGGGRKKKFKALTRELMLENIQVTSENGNSRKVGPIVSERVYQYLFGINGTHAGGDEPPTDANETPADANELLTDGDQI